MIKSIHIQNFQSHKDSYIELDKGCNVIVGGSDSGKTSIIRALRWLIFGRPTGDEMRSHWGGKTSVEVFTDDAHIVRSKDKEQEYILGDTHFKAFKTDVPQEVQQALNIDDTNLQRQLDAPFLLSMSSGEVATYLNKIAKLDKIDTGTSNVNKWIAKLKSDIAYNQEQVKKKNEELKQFDYLDKFEIEVEVLEELQGNLLTKNRQHTQLSVLIDNLFSYTDQVDEMGWLIELEEPVNDILDKTKLWKEKKKEYFSLNDLLTELVSKRNQLEEQKGILLMGDLVDGLLKLYQELKIKRDDFSKLIRLRNSIFDVKTKIELAEKYYDVIHKEFDENFPNVCPLCNKPK